jgi:type IV pili sensor histidine kinase/response regulator
MTAPTTTFASTPAAPVAPALAPSKVTTPAVAPTKTFAAPSATPVAARTSSVPPPVIKPAPVPKQIWEARVGESLRSVIKGWSQRVNYHVEWEPEDLDYPIDAPLRFEGSYEQALAGIFDLYKQADRSFIVDGHREQKRVNVTEDHRKRNTRSSL